MEAVVFVTWVCSVALASSALCSLDRKKKKVLAVPQRTDVGHEVYTPIARVPAAAVVALPVLSTPTVYLELVLNVCFLLGG